MKLNTFFKKFDQLADAPDAVARMRELVLNLAVRGKLVEQIPAEGNADSLLSMIANARLKSGRNNCKKGNEGEEVTASEGWYPAPASWRWVRLRTIGDIIGGGTPRSDNPVYFADNEGIPWLTPADLNAYKEKRIVHGRRYITKLGLENSSAQLLPEGSILFSSRAPIGYVAIAGTELATNQGFKSCVPFIKETNEFLYYYLKSAAARIDREASGTTFREVSGKIVNQIPVPLPPLAEQKRIVAKVDELMALCDRLEAQQQERDTRHAALARASLARFADAPTPANLDFLFHKSYNITPADLRKSILTLAVQGKLVPQAPNDQPVEDLIAQIFFEKEELLRKKVFRKTSAHTLRDQDTDEYELPTGWSWVTLNEITDIGTGSTPLKSQREYYEGGTIPWVTSAATNSKFVTTPEYYVTEKAVKECNLRLYPKGSLLIALYGQGKTRGQIAQLMFDSTTNQASAVIVFFGVGESIRDYVRLYFLKKYDELREQAAGGAQPNLSGGMIRLTRIPLPPLAEQHRIVAKVDQLMALVDELETQLAASQATAKNLLEAIVAELTTNQEATCIS